MNFDLSAEQQMVEETLERFLANTYDAAKRRVIERSAEGWSRESWRGLAELGLLGLPFPEAMGGFDAGAVGTMIIMRAFGRALCFEPFLATIVLGGGLIETAGSPAQIADLLPRVMDGTLLLAFAHSEPGVRDEIARVQTVARRDGADFVLSGDKTMVLHGAAADLLIVSARLWGEATDRDGIGLFIVRADALGLTCTPGRLQDRTAVADISLDGVRVAATDVLGEPGHALGVIELVVDRAIAAICAEACGAMEEAQRLTVDYLRTREQFGQAIGKFQALQHRAADMLVDLELARSMAMYAAAMVADPDPGERTRAVSAAKIQIGRSARRVGQEAIQLHGGIGATEEYALGHYARRLLMIEQQFGDQSEHVFRISALGGLLGSRQPAPTP